MDLIKTQQFHKLGYPTHRLRPQHQEMRFDELVMQAHIEECMHKRAGLSYAEDRTSRWDCEAMQVVVLRKSRSCVIEVPQDVMRAYMYIAI